MKRTTKPETGAKRLVLFDMDGTLFEHENFWRELHKALGTWEEGKKATEEWLHKDYDTLVDIVIHNLWKGKPAKPFLDLVANVKYLPGAKETVGALRRRGYELAVITSGPDALLARAKIELGIVHGVGNTLEVKDGVITGQSRHDDGNTMWPVAADNKVPIAERLCEETGCAMKDAIAIGDGRNDVKLFKAVGTSIAFNDAPPELVEIATHRVEGNDLRAILKLLP